MMLSTCACTDTSSAEVGSSQTRNSGCVASARAIEMRWRCPPENWCGNFSHVGRRPGPPTAAARRRVPRSAGLVGDQAVLAQRLADDVQHLPARVQAGVGVLEDHLHAPAQRRAGRLPTSAAPRRPGRRRAPSPRVGSYRPDQQPRHRALAAARFAHQRQRLAAFDAEADAVDRMHELPRLALDDAVEPGRRDVEGLGQVVDLDQRRVMPRVLAAAACSQQAARVRAGVASGPAARGGSARSPAGSAG